jgi:hypothetical protein
MLSGDKKRVVLPLDEVLCRSRVGNQRNGKGRAQSKDNVAHTSLQFGVQSDTSGDHSN